VTIYLTVITNRLKVIILVFTLYKLGDEDKELSVVWPVALQICQNAQEKKEPADDTSIDVCSQ